MKPWNVLTALAVGLALTTMPALAQDRTDGAKADDGAATPGKDEPSSDPSASPKIGEDKTPSAVDPAQSTKTGANTGDGASYNRSNDKGDSPLPKEGADKEK
jgi:hypothetical protein